jgi:hypothetical protein
MKLMIMCNVIGFRPRAAMSGLDMTAGRRSGSGRRDPAHGTPCAVFSGSALARIPFAM